MSPTTQAEGGCADVSDWFCGERQLRVTRDSNCRGVRRVIVARELALFLTADWWAAQRNGHLASRKDNGGLSLATLNGFWYGGVQVLFASEIWNES